MTLIAHWPLDDFPYRVSPWPCRDIAGGGSGFHDGNYSFSIGDLDAGGVGGRHLNCRSSYVHNITNSADLRLLGSMTMLGWMWPGSSAWDSEERVLASCHETDSGSDPADNDLYRLRNVASRALKVSWQYGVNVWVNVPSINDILPVAGLTHIGFVRYEISSGYYGVKFYVNGVLVDTQNNGGPGWVAPTGGGNAIPYVARDSSLNTNTIYIDSVRIYDSEESTANILTVYNTEKLEILAPTLDIDPTKEQIGVGGVAYQGIQSGPNSLRENSGWVKL